MILFLAGLIVGGFCGCAFGVFLMGLAQIAASADKRIGAK